MQLEAKPHWSDGHIALFLLTPDLVGSAYVDWLNDPAVNRFLESRFQHQDATTVRAFVAGMLASDRDLFLGIRDLELDRHVGNIKLGPVAPRHGLGEIGIMIGDRAAWGRGVGTRAIAILADIAGRELGLRKLTAGCYASNRSSSRAFEKAGFSIEGMRPSHFIFEGRPEDLVLMARFL